MNAFFFRASSLNADVRSTRTHSSSLAMRTPFFVNSPLPTRHYIACKQSGQADTSSRRGAPKRPPGLRCRRAWWSRSSGVRGQATTLRPGTFGSRPGLLRGFRWPDHKGDDRAADHDHRDYVEGEGVAVGRVYDAGDQQRPEHAAESPGGEHEPVVRPDVRRAEVVGVERRHRPEAAAVARDYYEGEHGQQEVHADQRQQEEQHGLQDEHDEEHPLAAYGV